MSDITKEQVIDWLSGQSVIEIADLVKELEEKWGVSAAAPAAVAVAAPADGGDAGGAAEEKSEFDVILPSLAGTRLQSSKKFVQSLALDSKKQRNLLKEHRNPLRKVIQRRSRRSLKKLEAAGAKAEIK